jgi:hypothetical protein
MCLPTAASVVSFVGALVIGIAAPALFVEIPSVPAAVGVPVPARSVQDSDVPVPLRAKELLGRWEGSWNYWGDSGGTCTIDIDRVDGNKFYGTLTQAGAQVNSEGKFDAGSGRVFFHETKVIKLGTYSQWLLGTYDGSFSDDGRTLSGSGRDSWNGYDWGVTKLRDEEREK